MRQQLPTSFDHLLHPYIFVLKEGKKINRDLLDYSLLMLQVGQADVIPSPYRKSKSGTPFIQLLKR